MKSTFLIALAATAALGGCRSSDLAHRGAGTPAASCAATAGETPAAHPRKEIVFKRSGDTCVVTAEHVVVRNGGSVGWTVRNQCAGPVTLSLDDKGHGPLARCQRQELTVAAGADDTIACTLERRWAEKASFCSAYGVEWEYAGGPSQHLDPILDIRTGTTP